MRISIVIKFYDGILHEKNGPNTKKQHAPLATKSYTLDFFRTFCEETTLSKKSNKNPSCTESYTVVCFHSLSPDAQKNNMMKKSTLRNPAAGVIFSPRTLISK